MRSKGWPMTENLDSSLHEKADPEAPPPVFGTWKRFYIVVMINTLAVYVLLLLFSHFAAR
jgi:hypothetical protein